MHSARLPKTVIRAVCTSNPVCLIWWFYHSSTSVDCGSAIGSSVDCSGLVTLPLRSRDTSCSFSPKVFLLLVKEHSQNMVFHLDLCAGVMPGSVLVRLFCLNSLKIWTSVAVWILLQIFSSYYVWCHESLVRVCVCVCLRCRSRWFVDRVSPLRVVVQTNFWFLPCGRSGTAVARSGTLSKLGTDFMWAFCTWFGVELLSTMATLSSIWLSEVCHMSAVG